MIKAIIFDCFGVLVTDSWNVFLDKYFKNNIQSRIEASKLMDLANEGSISNRSFIKGVGTLAGLDEQTTEEELSGNRPNLGLFEFIDDLKPKFKIGMLSNVSADLLDRLFSPEQLDKLDASVLSYEVKANKPEPITYETIAKKLGVMPKECIFVDDVQAYVEGASRIGMHAIQYKELDQVLSDVNGLISNMND